MAPTNEPGGALASSLAGKCLNERVHKSSFPAEDRRKTAKAAPFLVRDNPPGRGVYWFCGNWKRDVDANLYWSVVSGVARVAYSLQIGNKTLATDLTLKDILLLAHGEAVEALKHLPKETLEAARLLVQRKLQLGLTEN